MWDVDTRCEVRHVNAAESLGYHVGNASDVRVFWWDVVWDMCSNIVNNAWEKRPTGLGADPRILDHIARSYDVCHALFYLVIILFVIYHRKEHTVVYIDEVTQHLKISW